jgi:hypothetical protein
MATVYLAHDLRHDRRVAVKVLRPELAAIIGDFCIASRRVVADSVRGALVSMHPDGRWFGFHAR